MRGLSRASLAEVEERFNAAAGSVDFGRLADELFAIVALLDREHGLRRNLSDPSRAPEQKAQVATVLLEGKVSPAALETTAAAVSARWTRAGDLPDALERFGVLAAVAEAESQGRLDDLEDELFRFSRIVESNPDLRRALGPAGLPDEGKSELVRTLLDGRATTATLRLVTHAVLHPRGRSLERGLEEFGLLAAQQRQRLVAVVRSAVPLTDEQKQRLGAWLRTTYGRDVQLNVEVDPRVLGGFSVKIGDEIIDTTIAGRIEEVRRRLAG